MDLSSLTIDRLGLSVRAHNALRRRKIHTAEELLALTEEQLYETRNLGQKSVEEVLSVIDELKSGRFRLGSRSLDSDGTDAAERREEPSEKAVLSYLQNHGITIDALDCLSAPAYNVLRFSGNTDLEQIIFKSEEELLQLPHMTAEYARETAEQCRRFLKEKRDDILDETDSEPDNASAAVSIFDMLHIPEYHERILQNARNNDCELKKMGFSPRSLNRLRMNGYSMMSDIIFLSHSDLNGINALGAKSVKEIEDAIKGFLKENEAVLTADPSDGSQGNISDETVHKLVLTLYKKNGFRGYSLKEMMEALQLSETVDETRMKKILGAMLADHEIEYVDFRCYRLYEKFSDELERYDQIDERGRDIVRKRLEGITLENIAKDYDLTRERVRQIVKKTAAKAAVLHLRETDTTFFDEDYYRYFYETYEIEKKDAIEWLGIPESVFRYFEMMGVKKGSTDINKALEDNTGLDAGLRMKIRNYINRNKVFIDGIWVDKTRVSLERAAARKLCGEQVSFDDFVKIYNSFLAEQEINDEDLLIAEAVSRTRLNRLFDVRFLLWSWSETMRYYDIDGQDYGELFRELHLDAYENIELSTWKLFHDNPELMKKYDIRDHYELHNLLKKTVKNGDFHDFQCASKPYIRFGEFDRDTAILELIIDNAPINIKDLCAIVQDTYGYDPGTTQGTYLQPFSEYYHQGMYTIDQKAMTAESREKLLNALTDDFYYIEEIRKAYMKVCPQADPEEINAYNLKQMGFLVLSRYAVRNYPSLEAYFRSLLMDKEIVNMNPIKYRFKDNRMFYQVLLEARKNLDLIEFEPDQYIGIRKLEKSGVTKENLLDFCDEVFNAVNEGEYFSICSLRKRGFESELFDLGFSDMFYAGILQSDDRFFYSGMLGTTMFRLGKERLSIRSLVERLVREEGSIDFIDLLSILNDDYGCSVQHRSDILLKIEDTDLYYDKTLDRLYMNVELFYREFDEAEGF